MAQRSNIELKAKVADLADMETRCIALGAERHGVLVQRDTYFKVAHGRLKLREQKSEAAQLIFYLRADTADARESRFTIVEVGDASAMLTVLDEALGLRGRVEKQRTLYMWHGVRIHLDTVEGLGEFVEIEAPVRSSSGTAHAHEQVRELRKALDIHDADLVVASYCELAGEANLSA